MAIREISRLISDIVTTRGDWGLKHFKTAASNEAVDQKVLAIARAFDAARSRADARFASGHLGKPGVREAYEEAARTAETALAAIEKSEFAGYERHIATLRAEIFTPPPEPDGSSLTTRADLRLALNQQFIRAAIFDQVRQLDPDAREVLARTTHDPDVLRVLESGLPIIRNNQRDTNGPIRMAHVEKIIPDEVRHEVQRQRARAERPEQSERLDELEGLYDAARGIVNLAREQIGSTLIDGASVERPGTGKMQPREPVSFTG